MNDSNKMNLKKRITFRPKKVKEYTYKISTKEPPMVSQVKS